MLLVETCVSAGKLYAVGGYDGASRQCLSSVEVYDPVTNQWCYVADMSTRRSGAGRLFLYYITARPYFINPILHLSGSLPLYA